MTKAVRIALDALIRGDLWYGTEATLLRAIGKAGRIMQSR
jgi:hypothetical protein